MNVLREELEYSAENERMFSRSRVDRLLQSALKHPAVAVIAGSGYGKTYAVSSFLQKLPDTNQIWLQLSETDNMPSAFWEHYTNALAAVNPEFAARVAAEGFPPAHGRQIHYEDLAESIAGPRQDCIFVIDDLHVISNKEVLWFIQRIVISHPAHITLIIITRECNYPGTEWLLTYPDMGRIEADDLLFTNDEMSTYFRGLGTKVNSENIAHIYRETRGWPWSVSLAARLSYESPDDIEYVTGALRQNITKLIEGELIAVITPDEKKMLVKLSLLRHHSIELIAQMEGALKTLQNIARNHTLVRFDSRMFSYRIHDTLLEYLRNEQGLLTDGEREEVLRTAAKWCAANGCRMDALGYYEQISDYVAIIKLCYTLPVAIPFDLAEHLIGIFETMPPENLDTIPEARIVYTRLFLSLGRIAEVKVLLKDFVAELESRPSSPTNSRILLGLNNNLGYACLVSALDTCEYDFDVHFERADNYLKDSGFTATGPITKGQIGAYACRVGSPTAGGPEEYIAALTRAVPHMIHTMNGCYSGLDDLARAELAYYKNEMSECERFSLQSLSKAREYGQDEVESRALFFLLSHYVQAGKYTKVKDTLGLLDTQMGRAEFPSSNALHEIITGWFYATIGENGKVAHWLKSTISSEKPESYVAGVEAFTRIAYHLSEKNFYSLLALLEDLPANLGFKKYLLGKIAVLTTEAVCHYNLKNQDQALIALKAAYELATPNKLDMPFIELGNSMRSLTGAALKTECGIPPEWLEMIRSKSASYAKRVAYIRAQYREENDHHGDILLTPKELDILSDICHGLSRSEIAADHAISINTVKVMIQNLLDKLGAENSVDAVRIAMKNNLIED
jgi:LuxR family maltose regulon positive regulatory protein